MLMWNLWFSSSSHNSRKLILTDRLPNQAVIHNISQTSYIHHFGKVLIAIELDSYIHRKNPAYV